MMLKLLLLIAVVVCLIIAAAVVDGHPFLLVWQAWVLLAIAAGVLYKHG